MSDRESDADRERVREALSQLPESVFEQSRIFGESGAEFAWLPIATARSAHHGMESRVGLSRDGEWLAESANALLHVRPEHPVPPLLCWLEDSPDAVREELCDGLALASLPVEFAQSFPLDVVAEYGLRTTEHWTAHALRWLEADVPITPCVAEALGAILHEPALPAETRRRAAVLVRQHLGVPQ